MKSIGHFSCNRFHPFVRVLVIPLYSGGKTQYGETANEPVSQVDLPPPQAEAGRRREGMMVVWWLWHCWAAGFENVGRVEELPMCLASQGLCRRSERCCCGKGVGLRGAAEGCQGHSYTISNMYGCSYIRKEAHRTWFIVVVPVTTWHDRKRCGL